MRHKGFRTGDAHAKGQKGKHERFEGRDERRPRVRAQRGDVRTAVLLIVAEQPQNGYQIMQAISQRTAGVWQASPGAVYPAIGQLADDGLVTVQEDGGRRLVTITAAGLAQLDALTKVRGDPFEDFPDDDVAGSALSEPLDAISAAARQVEASGSPRQVEAAVEILVRARRALYLVLAEDDESLARGSQDQSGTD